MQESNVIYEITRQIQDKDNIQNDINQAFNLVTDMFKKKYINKIDEELKLRIDKIDKNPPKEIVLLNAIKLFLDKSNHQDIDNTINVAKNFFAIASLKENLNKNKESLIKDIPNNMILASSVQSLNIDDSVKDDGVYDIDESCIFGINNKTLFNNNILIILIILMFIMK